MHEEADECVVSDAAMIDMAKNMPENYYEWDANGDLEPGWDGRIGGQMKRRWQPVKGRRLFQHAFQACLFEWRNDDAED